MIPIILLAFLIPIAIGILLYFTVVGLLLLTVTLKIYL